LSTPKHIDPRVPLDDIAVARFAQIFREGALRYIADKAVDFFEERARIEEKVGRPLPAAEDIIPSVREIAALGREPFCAHGFAPMARCGECMVVAVMAASVQIAYKAAYDSELPDEIAHEWAARVGEERRS
jgi:hypothetical protein